jgi:hypothetical protein
VPPLPRRGRSASEVAERGRLRACARDALVAFGAAELEAGAAAGAVSSALGDELSSALRALGL